MQERIDELKKACPCLFQDGAKFWSSDKLTYGALFHATKTNV